VLGLNLEALSRVFRLANELPEGSIESMLKLAETFLENIKHFEIAKVLDASSECSIHYNKLFCDIQIVYVKFNGDKHLMKVTLIASSEYIGHSYEDKKRKLGLG